MSTCRKGIIPKIFDDIYAGNFAREIGNRLLKCSTLVVARYLDYKFHSSPPDYRVDLVRLADTTLCIVKTTAPTKGRSQINRI